MDQKIIMARALAYSADRLCEDVEGKLGCCESLEALAGVIAALEQILGGEE